MKLLLENCRKLNIQFDMNLLLEAYNTAIERIGFSGDMVNCISLTRPEDGSADNRGIFWTRNDDYEEVQVERFVNESAYKVFEPILSETYFKHIHDVLSQHYEIGRVRILKLDSRTSLSYHRDPEARLHIPIITNPGALMIINKEAYHMKADGSVYYTDTTKYHTALNGGDECRVHLVATVLGEAKEEEELYAIYGGD